MRRNGAMMEPGMRLCMGRDGAEAGEQRQQRGAGRDAQHPLPRELHHTESHTPQTSSSLVPVGTAGLAAPLVRLKEGTPGLSTSRYSGSFSVSLPGPDPAPSPSWALEVSEPEILRQSSLMANY